MSQIMESMMKVFFGHNLSSLGIRRSINDICNISAGLKSISKCSKILILKLGICSNITDAGLTYVGRGCSKLKVLDLYRFVYFVLFPALLANICWNVLALFFCIFSITAYARYYLFLK